MRANLTEADVAMAAMTAHAEDARTTVQLTTGWRFHQGDVASPPAQAASTEAWAPVSAPHSWNGVGCYIPEPDRHVSRAETINKYQGFPGIAWTLPLLRDSPANATGCSSTPRVVRRKCG